MDKLNDALECNSAEERKKKIYIASFSFGTVESMAMWSMYGAPYKQGIRLTIPKRAITKTLKKFEQDPIIYSTETGNIIPKDGKIVLKMMDVAYVHPGSLEYNKKKILRHKTDLVEKAKTDFDLSICLKNEIWLYENETRMILELEKELPGNVEKIAIDFNSAANELEITGSPCISKKELKQSLKKLNEQKIHESFAYCKVYFKDCKDCNKRTDFCKNNKKETRK